jgi:hypothetical protein
MIIDDSQVPVLEKQKNVGSQGFQKKKGKHFIGVFLNE